MNESMLQLICAAGCLGGGFLSGYISNMNDYSWYDGLKQPPFRPPNYLFSIVWTTLYTLIGIGLGSVFAVSDAPSTSKLVLWVFAIQLFFNFLWSPIFFKYHLLKYSFIWILILWGLILLNLMLTTAIDCHLFGMTFPVAYLFVPYLCWVTFASVLNGSIYALNGE